MVTISKYLILKNCTQAPQNTIKAPNLHIAEYFKNALTDFKKIAQLLAIMIVLDIPIENESRKLLSALENNTELWLTFDRHFLSQNKGFVYHICSISFLIIYSKCLMRSTACVYDHK